MQNETNQTPANEPAPAWRATVARTDGTPVQTHGEANAAARSVLGEGAFAEYSERGEADSGEDAGWWLVGIPQLRDAKIPDAAYEEHAFGNAEYTITTHAL